MHDDPITNEIRTIRHALAAQFDNDVSRILEDVRKREAADGRVYVRLPKRPVPARIMKPSSVPEPPSRCYSNEQANLSTR